jgi:hypothetical protein
VRGKSVQTRQLPSIKFGSGISATRRCCTEARWVFVSKKHESKNPEAQQGPRPTRARDRNLPDT